MAELRLVLLQTWELNYFQVSPIISSLASAKRRESCRYRTLRELGYLGGELISLLIWLVRTGRDKERGKSATRPLLLLPPTSKAASCGNLQPILGGVEQQHLPELAAGQRPSGPC